MLRRMSVSPPRYHARRELPRLPRAASPPATYLAIAALICLLIYSGPVVSAQEAEAPQRLEGQRVTVFLDCQNCHADYLRTEVAFVNHVRERSAADVHVLVTSAETASGGREYTLSFIGQRSFAGTERTLRSVTAPADTTEITRRQLATTLRVGLLPFVTGGTVPADLEVSAAFGGGGQAAQPARDRWNSWVFNLQASASFQGEEAQRERQLGAAVAANRITPNWKITMGAEFDDEAEEFDLDEEDPVSVRRRERDFDALTVKALGEHWSIGAIVALESSTFDNTALSVAVAPAVEFNVFPYSAYTRRQLRSLYALGVERRRYYERTLFGKTRETLPLHELSLTYEQRERWGSLQARTEWSQFLNQRDKTRLEVEGDVNVRVARGLSVGVELSASRIRDQIALPARNASAEEILLRLRRLQSGYEYNVQLNVTYSFGSVFSSLVNPRFGR